MATPELQPPPNDTAKRLSLANSFNKALLATAAAIFRFGGLRRLIIYAVARVFPRRLCQS